MPQIIPHKKASHRPRGEDESRKKKLTGEGTVSAALANLAASLPRENQMRRAAGWAAREWSGIRATQLKIEHVAALVSKWEAELATSTAYAYTRALRRLLRFLERHHHAPPLAEEKIPTPRYPGPRTQIASDEEIANALRIASPAMKTILLLCADCGLRSNEAVSIAPEHYSAETKTLTWKVKGGWSRSLPVTERMAVWLSQAPDAGPSVPFAEAFHTRGSHRKQRSGTGAKSKNAPESGRRFGSTISGARSQPKPTAKPKTYSPSSNYLDTTRSKRRSNTSRRSTHPHFNRC